MTSSYLDNKEVSITVEYRFTTYDEDLDEDLIRSLAKNEPITHVLSLVGSGSGLEWRDYRSEMSVNVRDID